MIGKISTVNKYASRSFFRMDLGDFIAGELISKIWAPPDSDAKFYLYEIGSGHSESVLNVK